MLHIAKAKIQAQAIAAWKRSNCWGILAMATGTGKSKIFVDQVKEMAKLDHECVFVVVVPTQKLRDQNWKEEFEKWDALDIWETRVIKICYPSLKKLQNENIGILCLDEGHRLTKKQETVFTTNTIKKCLVLTATLPGESGKTDMDKQMVFRDAELRVVFEYSLLQALQDKVVADFDITLIKVPIDSQIPYLKRGKFDPSRVTEKEYFDYVSSKILLQELNGSYSNSQLKNDRARVTKSLKSKSLIAKELLPNLQGRFIVYCGSKDQCGFVMGHNVYHSSSGNVAFKQFVDEEIDQLGAIGGLNEGMTLPKVDGVFILSMTTKLRDFIQRLGRAIRFRENFKAKCYIVATEGTIDFIWTKKVLRESKLKYTEVSYKPKYVQKINTGRTV